MNLHLVTRCGRYGKCHGEPFLRRRSSNEPMDTPRRYYETEEQYQEGQRASTAAWEQWKRERFGDADISRTPWFELVDRKLREINSLIQSSDDDEFRLGLQELRDRVSASEHANSSLVRVNSSPSKDERWRWLQEVRKAPPVLAIILNYLESDTRRDEGKEKLFDLCDDVVASQTIRGPTISRHIQDFVAPAHPEGQAEKGYERTETQIALSQLGHLVPPPGPAAEPTRQSNTSSRFTSTNHAKQASGAPSVESYYSARTNPRASVSLVAPPRPFERRIATHKLSRENSIQRPPTGVGVHDFAVGAENQESARPQRPRRPPQKITAPASVSPQTALYIAGGGTKPPIYISPSKFFPPEHGDEHGIERPPAYKTEAPSVPPAANFMPRDALGEDAHDIRMEGRRDQIGW
ncbi:hypothetical protein F5882DRAFT_375438 [Hyaloscypha sp. PMI_1271]|nr:hypothetical protein F5882DRAFT_375438 [Hyaloscypha sp. PMI_1271]